MTCNHARIRATVTTIEDARISMKKERGLFERPKGSHVWWVRYHDATGKERREKAGTLSAARKLYSKRKQQTLEGRKLPELLRAGSVTFNELLDDAIEHCQRYQTGGPDRRYTCKVDLIRKGLGGLTAESITPQEIARWRTKAQRENGWKPATANRYMAFVSLSFRLAIQNRKCGVNPARSVQRLRENNGRIRFLSGEEEIRLRRAIQNLFPERIGELDIAINTGMRLSEQYTTLKWKNVDLVARRITLTTTKNHTARHIPLNSVALAAFVSMGKEHDESDQIFRNADDSGPLLKPRYWWQKVIAEAKIADFKWHDLRHTFASRCVMAGVDLRTLQQLLGHKTLAMVVRYTHLSSSHELAAVERLCTPAQDTGTTTGTADLEPSIQIAA